MPFSFRPYQLEIVASIWNSIIQKQGHTFTVEIARQGGKNEISARLELLVLVNYLAHPHNLIKCSPTFKPQTLISLARLKDKLNEAGFSRCWRSENGHILTLGQARAIFLSADRSANVVGNTAHLLLEVDEAQDVSEEKYTKEFRPMGSTTNVTNVLYGTTWDDATLLEKLKQANLELERKDGLKRHFRYDWQAIARYNPDYLTYVESERNRLGEDHPLFLTQYRLLPVHGGGRFFNSLQKAQLQGHHARRPYPEPGRIYVAAIDLAGESESAEDAYLTSLKPRLDSTVVTIAELDVTGPEVADCAAPHSSPTSSLTPHSSPPPSGLADCDSFPAPAAGCLPPASGSFKIVQHYVWNGVNHAALYPRLLDLLKNVWSCRRVVVDSTGLGQPVASFLRRALGSRIVPFDFTSSSKSQLGFDLLAAVNSGRLKMYAADNSPEYQEFWFEMDKAQSCFRPSRTLNFFVDPSDGHDDFLMSLGLLVRAGQLFKPRQARGLPSP